MKRISIGTWAYSIGPYASNPVPFDEVVDKLAALGFDGIDLGGFAPHPNPDTLATKSQRDEVRKKVADAGLGFSGLAADLWSQQLVDAADNTAYLDCFRKNLQFAQDLGIDCVRVDTVQPPTIFAEVPEAVGRDWVVKTWKTAAREAASRGIRVVWEFEPGFAFNKPSDILGIVEEVGDPNFGVLYDTCHAHMCAAVGARQPGERETLAGGALELAQRLRGKIGHIHLIDSDGTLHDDETSTHAPFGDGVLDFDALLPELNRSGAPTNWWTIDLCFWPDAWKVTEQCKASVDRLNAQYGRRLLENPAMATKLNIGIIGYGFMGRAHSNAYRKVNQFFDLEHQPVLKAACARDEGKLKAFSGRWGWESTETDWRQLVSRGDIDAIDICTPNNTHLEIALAAASAGKMVLCEKPLAMNGREAREMVDAIERAGVPNLVWFNYRRVPAIALAKQVVDEGRIGRPFHYRAQYLQDWTINPDLPLGGPTLWRLDAEAAGAGVTGDLISHSVDTALWLNGPIQSVTAMTEIFVKERPVQGAPEQRKPVTIDDACQFMCRFANGSLGLFESTRYARGRKNYNTLELNGETGSVYFDLEDAHRLQFYDHGDPDHLHGWRSIHVTGFEHPYMANWWVPGCSIGYEHTFINTLADFLKGLETGEPARPNFRDGLATQVILDAVLESARTGQWIDIAW